MELTELYKKFIKFEQRNELFSYKLDGVYIWERIRFKVFRELKQALNLIGQAHTKIEDENFYDMKVGGRCIKDTIFHNPLFIKRNTDFLFIGHHRRKKMEDGYYWDIYTDPIVDELEKYDRATIEDYHLLKHLKPAKTKNLYYTGVIKLFSKVLNIIFGYKLNKEVIDFIGLLNKNIQKEFNVTINMNDLVKRNMTKHQYEFPIWKFIFNTIKPKIIFIICSYGKENMIKAAKILEIPIVELQHGVLSRCHLGYSYESGKPKRDFPDYFFSFGKFWTDNVDLPISEEKTFTIGYPYLEEYLKENREVSKKNKMVFISQGTIGRELSEFAVETAKLFSDKVEIVYKLHPGEYARWRKEYPILKEEATNNSITVIDNDTVNLYNLFRESKWVIGCSSTAVYESIAFNCVPYIVKLHGYEYMNPIIRSGHAKLIKKPEEIDFSYEPKNLDKNNFFANNWRKRLKTVIKKVMES